MPRTRITLDARGTEIKVAPEVLDRVKLFADLRDPEDGIVYLDLSPETVHGILDYLIGRSERPPPGLLTIVELRTQGERFEQLLIEDPCRPVSGLNLGVLDNRDMGPGWRSVCLHPDWYRVTSYDEESMSGSMLHRPSRPKRLVLADGLGIERGTRSAFGIRVTDNLTPRELNDWLCLIGAPPGEKREQILGYPIDILVTHGVLTSKQCDRVVAWRNR